MNLLDLKEVMKSSWLWLFTITGFSFFLFAFLLKFLNGSYSFLFVITGGANILLAFVCFINKLKAVKEERKNPKKRYPIFDDI